MATPQMSPSKPEHPFDTSSRRAVAIIIIVTALLGGVTWLNAVAQKADAALELGKQAVTKEDFKDMKEDIKEIRRDLKELARPERKK